MKRKILIGGGIVILVLVLVGAAFVGGQLLNGQGLAAPAAPGGLRFTSGNQTYQLDLQPAKELPQTPADAKGIFDHRQDNSIFVGTGKVTMMVQKDQSGNVSQSVNHDGPTVEIVITPQTILYRDVTMQQFNGQLPSGKTQQVVEPGAAADIGQYSSLTVWGKKTGDRITADVLVYTPPPVLFKR